MFVVFTPTQHFQGRIGRWWADMETATARQSDNLFANCDHSWAPDPDDVIKRIDDTLDLIASAIADDESIGKVTPCEVSIIVPVFNERETLPRVLARIEEVMPRATETIVVDDGSTDGTAEWLRQQDHGPWRRVFYRRRNHGKGSAVRLAIRHSRGRVVAIQDADLEYDPADLLRVIWPIVEGECDVVYGSRYLDAAGADSFVHRAGNRLLTTLSNAVTGLRLTDMETCHKAFSGDLIRSIPLRERRFGFEPEITAKIAARRARVKEVPTAYQARSYDGGKKIGWRDAFAAIACMWKYRGRRS